MNDRQGENSTTKPLTVNELRLASLLFEARSALWREWVEAGSEAARLAFDNTDPVLLIVGDQNAR